MLDCNSLLCLFNHWFLYKTFQNTINFFGIWRYVVNELFVELVFRPFEVWVAHASELGENYSNMIDVALDLVGFLFIVVAKCFEGVFAFFQVRFILLNSSNIFCNQIFGN